MAAYFVNLNPAPVRDVILKKNERHVVVNVVAADVRQHATGEQNVGNLRFHVHDFIQHLKQQFRK